MVRSLYQFHMYYHMRLAINRLQVPLPCESGFNATNNHYSSEGFFKLCEAYGVPHNPIRYQNKKFFGTHQHGSWLDYIGPDSMAHWIIEKSQGSMDVGLLIISESVRAYMYLILSSQASARPHIVANTASALTA